MKYEYISNFSKEKLVKLCPAIKRVNAEVSGTKALVINYGLYEYELDELFDEVKAKGV